jgi:hypothetical protein
METIRCKLKCTEIIGYGSHGVPTYTYKFNACYSDKGEENQKFWEATPSASFEMSCTDVKGVFVLGEFYYFDLSPAPHIIDE